MSVGHVGSCCAGIVIGYLRIKDMVRAGIWLNLISVVLLTATVFTLGRSFLGIEI